MRQTSVIIFILIALLGLSGCIEKYFPSDILENEENYVVSGRITNNKEYHLVKISKTTSISLPRYRAAIGCEVKIIDSENNTFISDYSTTSGEYYVRVEQELLEIGKAFKVVIRTPEGIEIESAFDTLKPAPDIKNLYVQRLDMPTADQNIMERGVQFKVDLEADDNFDRFYNWEMDVTYEYRSAYPITHYYDGEIHEMLKPDYSLYYCWKTEQIKDFFPLSTKALGDNSFAGHNLHFVNNRTQRLMHQYSVLLYQSAISEAYFNFLDQLRRNSSDQEGLFGTQPITVVGNLTSTSHPETRVLGFFSVESVKSHRYFFSNVMDVPFEIPVGCIPYMPLNGFGAFHPSEYPLYLVYDADGELGIVTKSCIDCRLLGGETTKPIYWP
jgi:predicted dithiol-disulfide oxidoreductase (DUF899 family)